MTKEKKNEELHSKVNIITFGVNNALTHRRKRNRRQNQENRDTVQDKSGNRDMYTTRNTLFMQNVC